MLLLPAAFPGQRGFGDYLRGGFLFSCFFCGPEAYLKEKTCPENLT